MKKGKIGRPKRDDEINRKQLVLDTAINKISEAGFEKVTLVEIGEHAGVNPALIRHYFGGKQGLFDACTLTVKHRLVGHFNLLQNRLAETPNGFLLQALIDFFRDEQKEEQIIFGYMCWLFLKGGKDADDVYTMYHETLEQYVETYKQRGVMASEVSTYWFVQQCISMQMGPYFLAKPIRSHSNGKDPFGVEISSERSVSTLRTLAAVATNSPPSK